MAYYLIPVTSLKPFIGTVEHLRRELAWGMSIHRASLSLIHPETFKLLATPTRLLGESILQGMDLVRSIVSLTYQGGIKPYDFRAEKCAIVEAESQLLQTKTDVRNELEGIFETLGPSYSQLPQDVCDLSLAMISLLQVSAILVVRIYLTLSQMGTEVQKALQVCTRMMTLYESSSYRIWYPRISMAWLGLPPRSLMFDEQEGIPVEHRPHESNLTVEEAREGVEEYNRPIPDEDTKSEGGSTLKKVSQANPGVMIQRVWRSTRVVKIRLRLSGWERAIHHSPHLQHAFKNAAGVALLSLPAFLPPDFSGTPTLRCFTHSLTICPRAQVVCCCQGPVDGGFVRVGPGNQHGGNLEDRIPPPRWNNHRRNLCLPLLPNREGEPIRSHSIDHGRGLPRDLDHPQYHRPTAWSRNQCHARPHHVCGVHTTPP